jgi:phosphatidate cytidylyltransferase
LLILQNKDGAFTSWAWVVAGIVYIGWMLSYWSELRNLENGRGLAYWSMLTIMMSDTCAFFVGRTWGKHRMAPSISPKKTWEGAAGGLLGGIIVSIILGILFTLPFTYWQLVIFGFGISVVAQIGDMVESLLKRNTTVKDSGKLLPGHGGILDRIDSFILTGFLVYYCALTVIAK